MNQQGFENERIKTVIKFYPETGKVYETNVNDDERSQRIWSKFLTISEKIHDPVEKTGDGRYIVTLKSSILSKHGSGYNMLTGKSFEW